MQLLENKTLLQEQHSELESCHRELEQKDQQENLLQKDLNHLQTLVKQSPLSLSLSSSSSSKRQPSWLSESPVGDYDLRDILLLPKVMSDREVMRAFQSKWQLTSPLYERCGVVKSIAFPSILPAPVTSTKPCRIAIISSWFPRPCGIATHSHMLYDGIRHTCPPNSEIDVIAVRNINEDESIFPSEVTYSFAKSSLEEYTRVADHINRMGYDSVILGYEFGLFEDEYLLCLLRRIDISRTQIITILHTLADNLPYQKQALTQQV